MVWVSCVWCIAPFACVDYGDAMATGRINARSTQIVARVPNDDFIALAAIAKSDGATLSAIVLRAIREMLDRAPLASRPQRPLISNH